MKIIRTKEDIQGDMWCRATEENFNALCNLGMIGISWDSIVSRSDFMNSDIFFLLENGKYIWQSDEYKSGIEVQLESKEDSLVKRFGFIEPETFKFEILKVYNNSKETEYIGTVNNNVPAKWNSEGICLNLSSEYNLYKEYKQRIYTKPNSIGFYPKQKFIISSTEKMSTSLEKQGWVLATNDEIENFKY